MRLLGHRVDPGGVDPAVVEVEERAHRDREVQRLVGPPQRPEAIEIRGRDLRRLVVDPIDEPEERLVLVVER